MSGSVSTFSGAISNSGTISARGVAINVSGANNAITIDQSAGLISGTIELSANANADMLNISGGSIAGNIVGSGIEQYRRFSVWEAAIPSPTQARSAA